MNHLHELDEETLIALANRGLVKRAARELASGTGPVLTPGDPVIAVFPDGSTATLATGANLDGGTCTCAATGVCRHLVGLVLAYQRDVPRTEASASWSAASISDDALERAFGTLPLKTARTRLASGYDAVVRDPATVELPGCTVHFPVLGEPGLAHTDAAPTHRAESIVMAAWALGAVLDGERVRTGRVRVGGIQARSDASWVISLVDELLLEGVVHAGPLLVARVERAARQAAGLHWIAGALTDLHEQFSGYAGRTAQYEAVRVAELLAELSARVRTGALGGDEPNETPLRRIRLVGLGCRITGTPGRRTAELFFAHNATTLVLRRTWNEEVTGAALARRRLVGTTVGALATGNLVSETASRSASRVLRIGTSRIAQTSVTPVDNAWRDLPVSCDYTALLRELEELPPRCVRPRVEAETVRVLAVTSVGDIGYDPAAQCFTATLLDSHGTAALAVADHSPCAPAALSALAAALAEGPQLITGSVRRTRGTLYVTPLALRTASGVIVPDLASGDDLSALPLGAPTSDDPLAAVLDQALKALAEASHHGLRHPAGLRSLTAAAQELAAHGFGTSADLLNSVAAQPAPKTWLTAQLHLQTAADLR